MTGSAKQKLFVFSDFDGTITAVESLEAVFREFLPGRWDPVKERILAGEATLREAVPGIIEQIPSHKCPEIIDFVSKMPIRDGFEGFLDFLDENGIPLVIVSGGVRKMVEIKLGELINRVHEVVAVDVDASQSHLRVHSRYEGGDELVDKASVINRYQAEKKIVIGDGLTDFNMARHADLVFARDSLAGYLEKNGIPHIRWNDFTDIKRKLRQWLTPGNREDA